MHIRVFVGGAVIGALLAAPALAADPKQIEAEYRQLQPWQYATRPLSSASRSPLRETARHGTACHRLGLAERFVVSGAKKGPRHRNGLRGSRTFHDGCRPMSGTPSRTGGPENFMAGAPIRVDSDKDRYGRRRSASLRIIRCW